MKASPLLLLLVAGTVTHAGKSAADTAWASDDYFVAFSPVVLGGFAHLEAETRLDKQTGVFLQARTSLTPPDARLYGGQVAYRHHFRDVGKGFFLGGFADANFLDLDQIHASAYSIGGHWGGRWPIVGRFSLGFRLGLGFPIKVEVDRPKGDSQGEEAALGFLDREFLAPVMAVMSVGDGDVALGWSF